VLSTYLSPGRRIVLIGDAAHAFPPTGGQGAALAFEDAETLAYAISRSTPEETFECVLRKWEAHRMERIAMVRRFAATSGITMKPLTYFQNLAKEWMMWAYMKIKGLDGGMGWIYHYNSENVIGALC
jgi:2-polyprenyl-6-methoxyphenol hydroxylase-like FAD-dependent oxidoreductase